MNETSKPKKGLFNVRSDMDYSTLFKMKFEFTETHIEQLKTAFSLFADG